MDIKQTINVTLDQAEFFINAYLADITTEELLTRPVPNANHIAWQLGHLIQSERYLVERAAPNTMSELPDDFTKRHTKQTAANNDPAAFLKKEQYLDMAHKVRAETRKAVETLSTEQFAEEPIGKVPPFMKTKGQVLLFIGGHWLWHGGQWVTIRRSLGRESLF